MADSLGGTYESHPGLSAYGTVETPNPKVNSQILVLTTGNVKGKPESVGWSGSVWEDARPGATPSVLRLE